MSKLNAELLAQCVDDILAYSQVRFRRVYMEGWGWMGASGLGLRAFIGIESVLQAPPSRASVLGRPGDRLVDSFDRRAAYAHIAYPRPLTPRSPHQTYATKHDDRARP